MDLISCPLLDGCLARRVVQWVRSRQRPMNHPLLHHMNCVTASPRLKGQRRQHGPHESQSLLNIISYLDYYDNNNVWFHTWCLRELSFPLRGKEKTHLAKPLKMGLAFKLFSAATSSSSWSTLAYEAEKSICRPMKLHHAWPDNSPRIYILHNPQIPDLICLESGDRACPESSSKSVAFAAPVSMIHFSDPKLRYQLV